ncbi:MAG TPA: DUF4166 domain-containing protein [Hyphomicrobium sp.]|jgi:hypothetical protein
MTALEKIVEARPDDDRPTSAPATLSDARFRTLVGEPAWAQLPEAVRRRFCKRLAPDEPLLYRGTVVTTELSRTGRILAFLARAIGSPLPLSDGATGPALVAVVEDERLGGQSWTRIYVRPGGFPQTIHSAKRFRGPTGLEEYVGYGIGMALRVTVADGALVFRSDHYFLGIGVWRWRWPKLLEPGSMEITHRDEGGGTFSFRLALTHPLLGRIAHQLAYFRDP